MAAALMAQQGVTGNPPTIVLANPIVWVVRSEGRIKTASSGRVMTPRAGSGTWASVTQVLTPWEAQTDVGLLWQWSRPTALRGW